MVTDGLKEVVLGAGCFWCVEAVYAELAGVAAVKSGYSGGHLAHPRYRDVCTGTTGHAEVVRVTYDPAVISFDDLLHVFFTIHDPTSLDRQGDDVGSQYRSVIFVADDEERARATLLRDEVRREGIWDRPIVTEIADGGSFWPAEEEHDQYFVNHPESGYCQLAVAPKLAKFRERFAERLRASGHASKG